MPARMLRQRRPAAAGRAMMLWRMRQRYRAVRCGASREEWLADRGRGWRSICPMPHAAFAVFFDE